MLGVLPLTVLVVDDSIVDSIAASIADSIDHVCWHGDGGLGVHDQ